MRIKPIIIILAFILILPLTSAWPKPIHYYTFDGHIDDDNEASNPDDLTGSYQGFQEGIIGQAINMTAASSHFLKNTTWRNASNVSTISCMIWPETTPNYATVLYIYDGSNRFVWWIDNSNKLQWRFNAGSGERTITSTSVIPDKSKVMITSTIGPTWGMRLYINESYQANNSDTGVMSAAFTTLYFGDDAGGNEHHDGWIDNCVFYNFEWSPGNVSKAWNNSFGVNYSASESGPPPVTDTFNFTGLIYPNGSTLRDLVININATADSHKNFTCDFMLNNKVNQTNSYPNGSGVNISFTVNHAFDRLRNNTFYVSCNNSIDMENTSLLWYVTNNSIYHKFTGWLNYSGINYTDNLTYDVAYICPAGTGINITFINDTYNNTCSGFPQQLNSYYQHTSEDSIVSILYYNHSEKNSVLANQNFTFDLLPPVASLFFDMSEGFGFNITFANISLKCEDNITPNLDFLLRYNNNTLQDVNATANKTIHNVTEFINGRNYLLGVCSDLFRNSTIAELNQTVYAKTLILIDEKNNTPFDVANASSARVYFDDNSSFFDFKTEATARVNFSSINNDKLRFELVYPDSTIVRWIDVSLVDEAELRVCANRDDVTHYEQLIIAATQKRAVLRSVFSDCYVAADYTRFAYQDAYLLKAYTINTLYYLYTYDSGSRVYLASVDGSVASYINLDTLEFQREGYDISILGETLSFQKTSTGEIKIYYKNLDDDNTQAQLNITRMDTDAIIFSTTETSDPNEITLYFDYTTLSGIDNTTLFKITLLSEGDSGSTLTTKYFNTAAQTGVLRTGFALILSILITIFGLSMTVTRITFSWFGLAVQIVSIAVLSFAITTWAVTFLMAINVIIAIFIVLLMLKENYGTVA